MLATAPLWRASYYVGGVLALSVFASFFIRDNNSPAALLFVMSPTLVTFVLRVTGDGWSDTGLRLSGKPWHYALALGLIPTLGFLGLGIGALGSSVHFSNHFPAAFALAFAKQLLPSLVFAFGEEWGWRGYLEPRLAAAHVAPGRRHFVVGVVWAVWHVPYILALGSQYTSLPLALQLPLFHFAVLAMAFIWGPLRTQSNSAWPAILGHGVANAVAFPLLSPALVAIDNPLWFAARPEGLVTLTGLSLVAVLLYKRSTTLGG